MERNVIQTLTYSELYQAMAVDDFRLNPLCAIHLDTNDLILYDSHNTVPNRVMAHRKRNYALVLSMRSYKVFEEQT